MIGAALGSGFSPTIGKANAKLTMLGKELKALSDQKGLIERFERDEAALNKARLNLEKSQKKVMALKLALRKDQNNAGLAKDLEKARAHAERMTVAVEKNRISLGRSERALRKEKIEVGSLAGKYDQLGREIDQARKKQDRFTKAAERKDQAGQQLSDIRAQVAAVAGAGYIVTSSIGDAMTFESAMADVRKTVDFDRPDGLIRLGKELKVMTRTIPIGATGMANIAAAGGQLGVVAKDLPPFVTQVAKMSTAFDMMPDEAGKSMAKLSNVYQIPITAIGKVGDAVNHLSDNSAATARDIVTVLGRVGGTARQFGLTAQQVSALAGTFLALGKQPEVAGTAINALLTKMQTATKQGKSFQRGLNAIGLSAEDMEQSISVNGQAAINDLFDALSVFDDGERAGILFDLFGQEYVDDISLLAGAMGEYRKQQLLVAKESAYVGSMQREFATRAATSANQLQLMKNQVNELSINFGSTLLPAVNSVLKPIGAVSSWAADVVERFPWIGRLVGGIAVGLAAFTTALTVVTAATWLWNAALIANPIGLTIAAVVGGVALIVAAWEPITEFFSSMWSGIKSLFSQGVGFLTKIWERSPVGLLFKAGQKLAGFIGDLFGEDEGPQPGVDDQFPGNSRSDSGVKVGASMSPRSQRQRTNVSPAGLAAEIASAQPAQQPVNQSTSISAPITIHATPGMDEQAVAQIVTDHLTEQQRRAEARQRGNLYD